MIIGPAVSVGPDKVAVMVQKELDGPVFSILMTIGTACAESTYGVPPRLHARSMIPEIGQDILHAELGVGVGSFSFLLQHENP